VTAARPRSSTQLLPPPTPAPPGSVTAAGHCARVAPRPAPPTPCA